LSTHAANLAAGEGICLDSRYLFWNQEDSMANFVKVAQLSDIPAGQGKCVEVGDKRIALFNLEGTVYALDDVCPHQGGPISEGECEGKVVTCPWHGWEFDVETGVNRDDSDVALEKFEVKVEGNDVLVAV
jgi:NAD(P)H-dependent nitrite reductase small subunit